jgi:hypothetical protein
MEPDRGNGQLDEPLSKSRSRVQLVQVSEKTIVSSFHVLVVWRQFQVAAVAVNRDNVAPAY